VAPLHRQVHAKFMARWPQTSVYVYVYIVDRYTYLPALQVTRMMTNDIQHSFLASKYIEVRIRCVESFSDRSRCLVVIASTAHT
jgi:hypothetical protein